MAKGHKPVAGSRAYWPKKRANRIYQSFKTYPSAAAGEGAEAAALAFAGYKAGMTRVVFVDSRKGSRTEGQEVSVPVTVLDCPALVVCGIRVYQKTPAGIKTLKTIMAEKLAKDLSRKIIPPKKKGAGNATENTIKLIDEQVEKLHDIRILVHTKPRESGIRKKKPELFEVALGGSGISKKWEYAKQKLGGEIAVEDVFRGGEWIDVKAVTIGKGFQGPVKRFGVKIRSRKNQGKRRHIGNIGSTGVGRVLPGKIAMAGQLGFQTRTEYNKKILKIGKVPEAEVNPRGGFINYGLVKGDYVLVQGSVPGPRKRLVLFRKGIRAPAKGREPLEIKEVFLDSQQGV